MTNHEIHRSYITGCPLFQETEYLPVTVQIDDINDNVPTFQGGPYNATVDETAPTGFTIFRGISALDRDKPATVNSEISYTITSGNEARKFSLESKHSNKAVITLNRGLDYDGGDRVFNLTLKAQVIFDVSLCVM